MATHRGPCPRRAAAAGQSAAGRAGGVGGGGGADAGEGPGRAAADAEGGGGGAGAVREGGGQAGRAPGTAAGRSTGRVAADAGDGRGPAAKPAARTRSWWPVAVAAGLLLAVGGVAAGIVMWVKVPGGVVRLEVDPPDAKVEVVDGKITVSRPGDAEPWRIELAGEKGQLKISKAGFVVQTREVTLSEKGTTIKVSLQSTPNVPPAALRNSRSQYRRPRPRANCRSCSVPKFAVNRTPGKWKEMPMCTLPRANTIRYFSATRNGPITHSPSRPNSPTAKRGLPSLCAAKSTATPGFSRSARTTRFSSHWCIGPTEFTMGGAATLPLMVPSKAIAGTISGSKSVPTRRS